MRCLLLLALVSTLAATPAAAQQPVNYVRSSHAAWVSNGLLERDRAREQGVRVLRNRVQR